MFIFSKHSEQHANETCDVVFITITRYTYDFLTSGVHILPQSSAEYRCEASNRAGRRNATVYVDVLNTDVMAHCVADGVWPLTGAGKSASMECPKNRSTSYASRTCVLTAANRTEWQKADYSRCAPDDLNKITMSVSAYT